MTFTISAPPHRKQDITFRKITFAKILALVPVSLVAVYLFGLYALALIIASVAAAVATEAIIQKALGQPLEINNGHAALIGLMVALVVPPEVPIWMPIIGSAFGVAIAKHAFGGLGSSIFNPVLAAWVFLSLAWWSLMQPVSFPMLGGFSDLVLETGAGHLIGASPIALIGGVFLIYRRYMEWRIPVFYFLTTIVLAVIVGDSLSYVITGAFIFGVLFLATDTPSSPVTKNGRVIYGVLCGVLTVVYGHFDNYIYATFYGLFLANSVAAFIDNNTMPSSYAEESFFQRKYRTIMDKIPFEKLGVYMDE
ncbi:electron transport complex protein RnfD [Methanohalophilus levihalophilus]|uniref:Rnf electron transport complex subunit RnfD n=1 Tax=Methanohalophilus levihalophilus TaxID=1431282 RepID=UPI001AE6EA78|nr:Rnf electron transport complex subunit RnfD [Methanohalophilus levihalophilus]MBP2030882.1 electron transport complex protein RnfD [Methanohalophilus levihalophilus]